MANTIQVMTRYGTRLLVGVTLCTSWYLMGMNFLRPYDTLIRMPLTDKRTWQLCAYAEGGVGQPKAFGEHGRVCDALNIWQTEQNALTMLQGFDQDSPMTLLRNELNAADNGVRGRFKVRGDLDLQYTVAFCARAHVLPHFSLGAYVPLIGMRLDNVCWQDETQDISDADVRVHELLTDPNVFFKKVEQFGHLCLSGWERHGCGDLAILLEWFRDFPQIKPLLKNVFVNWRFGLNLPTGLRTDESKLFAVPFGYDGATGLIFGVGLELTLGSYITCGADVQLTQLFDTVRQRRIKTDLNQTELLLLQTVDVHKDFGLVQRFNLDIAAVYHDFSCTFGYQYFKQGESKISLLTNAFSEAVANTAQSLQPITMHQLVVNARYGFKDLMPKKTVADPYISVYARVPFNGQRASLQTAVGAIVGVSF